MAFWDRFRRQPPSPPPPWPRPLHQPGPLPARVDCYLFEETQAAAFPCDLAAEGWAAEGLPDGFRVDTVDTTRDPVGWAEWIEPLAEDVGVADPVLADRLRGAVQAHLLSAELRDPPDLGHLQAAWAFVRARMRAGAFAAYDLRAWRWWDRESTLALPPQDHRPACAWRLLVHDQPFPEDPAGRHLLHTAGLAKVARAELISFVPPALLGPAQEVLLDLAHDQVLGRLLPSGEAFEHRGQRFHTEGYAPGFNAPHVPLPFEDQPLLLRFVEP